MHRPISAAYLERKLRSISGVLGSNPLPDLEDLKGLITLENDRPEWAQAAGEALCVGNVQFAAVAAQLMTARIHNPDASGMLVIVERVSCGVGVATGQVRGYLAYNLNSGDLATIFNTKVNRDPRGRDNLNLTVTAAILSGTTNAASQATGQQYAQMFNPGNAQTELVDKDDPLILPPGAGADVDFNVVNQAASVTWFWRERPIEGDFDLR